MPTPLYQYPGLVEPLSTEAGEPVVLLDWYVEPPQPRIYELGARANLFNRSGKPPQPDKPKPPKPPPANQIPFLVAALLNTPEDWGSEALPNTWRRDFRAPSYEWTPPVDLSAPNVFDWLRDTEQPPAGPRQGAAWGGGLLDPPGGEILPDHWQRLPEVPVPRRPRPAAGGSVEPPEQAPAAADLTFWRNADNPPLRRAQRPAGVNVDPLDTTAEIQVERWQPEGELPPGRPRPRPAGGSTEPPDATGDLHLGHWWRESGQPPRAQPPRPRAGSVEPPVQDAEPVRADAWQRADPLPLRRPLRPGTAGVHEIEPSLFTVAVVVVGWDVRQPDAVPGRLAAFPLDWFALPLLDVAAEPTPEPEPSPAPEPEPELSRVVIDDDTYRAIRRLWLASPLLARLFPDGPQAGRLKSPQTLPYAHVNSVQAEAALRQTCPARIDTRRVTMTVRGTYADVVAAVGELVRIFGRRVVLDYPSGVRFIRWWPLGDETLEQEDATFSGEDIWRGWLEAEVWSVRTDTE